eukprot:SAG11_NODE_657_length_7898_cov_13.699320_7_plen_63_part_00
MCLALYSREIREVDFTFDSSSMCCGRVHYTLSIYNSSLGIGFCPSIYVHYATTTTTLAHPHG